MKAIFEQLGYDISKTETSAEYRGMNFLVIRNTDGSDRWIWPEHVNTPLFLKFYAVNGIRSRAFAGIIRLIFLLRLQSVFFKKQRVYVKENRPASDFDITMNWALFTGTTGPNNKTMVCISQHGRESFIKIARTEKATKLLENEALMINRLYMSDVKSCVFPEILQEVPGMLQLSDISDKGTRSNRLTDAHIHALIELNDLTSIRMKLSENETWNQSRKDVEKLSKHPDNRLPKGMIRKLQKLMKQVNESEEIEVCLSHGDFTPWNMFVSEGRLCIYDWELADPFKPLGFDLFHFIIQKGILVERKNWAAIKQEIFMYTGYEAFPQLSKFRETDIRFYLKLYLILNTSYYLHLYAEQRVWHAQVHWLFNTWNEALSDLMGNQINQRELVLMDAFDFLLNKNYAAIKFQNAYPEQLSQFSDVDLCTTQAVSKELYDYLSRHPLVERIQANPKSFMSTQQIFCFNGELLSLDLIWKLKRKSLEILNVEDLLKNTYVNPYGVKMLDVYDNARYIGLFYALNNAPIPEKYNYYEELVARSASKLDAHLYDYFIGSNNSSDSIRAFIRSQASNRGVKGFMNLMNYILDSLKTPIRNSGTIITFSGVDGAGKSTVIDVLKYKLEKQLRKRVVILRHRPSLLPILSAWTKGKTVAEDIATRTLPRQGTNHNLVSSLFRFLYYYTDYLLGQFIVQVKYVWRGYVVIYDRYYFDFMNDAKRSNIVLPQFIFKTGFLFLLKPQFNFFLYADSETILHRKQELSQETIESLTLSYLNQFQHLKTHSRHASYISIKNNHLHETLHIVFDEITQRNAA